MTSEGGETVIESYNLFLNSDDATQNGQLYDFQFGNNTISTRNKEQFIRFTLTNFNMYKNWTDINQNNQGLVLRSAAGATSTAIAIPNQNYATLHDLAVSLGNAVATAVGLVFPAFGAITVGSFTPVAGTSIDGTTGNILGFTLTTANPHGLVAGDLTNGNFAVQSVFDPSNLPGVGLLLLALVAPGADSGLLLGIDRLRATSLLNSFNVDVNNPNSIIFTAKYPGQRSTEPNVYLRINPAPQVFASESFNRALTTQFNNPLNPSSIMAEIKIDTEFVQFTASTTREFFVDFYQKLISHFQMSLTDSRGRALPTSGTDQTTLGNRHFTACIRVDVIQGTSYAEQVGQREMQHRLPARFDSNLLIDVSDGKRTRGAPGYLGGS